MPLAARKQTLVLLTLAFACGVGSSHLLLRPKAQARTETPGDFAASLAERDLTLDLVPDRHDGLLFPGAYLCLPDCPMKDREQLKWLPKHSRAIDRWRHTGIVHVVRDLDGLQTSDENWHKWGHLWGFGDPELLRQIDEALAK
jgi:hypothetical protein